MRDQRLITRLSEGEKSLLLALRRQDSASEADLLAAMLRDEACRRIAGGRGTEEMRSALAEVEREIRGAGGSPPNLHGRGE